MFAYNKYYRAFISMLIAAGLAILAHSSCKYTSSIVEQPPTTVFRQPVPRALKFHIGKKINWATLPKVHVKKVVDKFDLDAIPAKVYDSSSFKPISKNDKKIKIDYNALPLKDFDLDRVSNGKLKFKTFILQPPILVKAGLPRKKNVGELPIYEFGEMQGLRGKFIFCVFTDRSGFLWIATDKFLYRYDGENLLMYQSVPYTNDIFGMMQDKQGRIWISTLGDGLEILDPANGTLKITNKAMGLGGDYLSSILQDSEQQIWVAAFSTGPNDPAGSLNIINPITGTVKILKNSPFFLNTSKLMEDHDHHIWISTNGHGLGIVSPENKKIRYFDKAHGLPSDTVSSLLCDHSGRDWIATREGALFELNSSKTEIQTFYEAKHSGSTGQAITEDRNGKIWFGTELNGLEIIDPEKLTVLNLKKANGLADNNIESICNDNLGQHWVATLSGLNMIGINGIITERIGKTAVTCQAEDHEGRIWTGGDGGVAIIDRKNGTIKNITQRQGLNSDTMQNIVMETNGNVLLTTLSGLDIIDPVNKVISHLTVKQGLQSSTIFGVFADKAGRLWIAGNNGLDVYNPADGLLCHLGKEHGLLGNFGDLTDDALGRIWASNDSGDIAVIDPITGDLLHLDNNDFIKNDYPLSIMRDDNDKIWAGTYRGLRIIDIKAKTITSFSVSEGLLSGGIISILKHDGLTYAATNRGITLITPPGAKPAADKKWHTASFGNSYGISKINIGYSQTDIISKDGLYWWGDDGITILDLPKVDTSTSIVAVTGLKLMDQPLHFINQPQFDLKKDDTLHGTGGIFYIKGQKPLNSGYTTQSKMSWDGVDPEFNLPVNLQLPHDQNFVQFQYANTDLSRRDTAWYRYKLLGADESWSAITDEISTKNYYNLQPGSYIFEVSTKNRNGTWSKPGVFSFSINPPWWQKWWAYILYIILLSGMIWGTVHLRSLKLIKEKRILEHKVHIRTEEVKSAQRQLVHAEKMASLGELTAGIAHEIQNPLNFVNNFSEVNTELIAELIEEIDRGDLEEIKAIASDIEENSKRINMHGKRADAIVKGMLQHSKATSGSKEPTNINTLANEYINLAYHGLRAKDKSFNVDMLTNFAPNLPQINIIPQDIGRVFLNLANNAFYAVNQKQRTNAADYKPQVSISTSLRDNQIVIKVKDNGVGIPDSIKEKIMQPFFTTKPTGEGTGLGLSLTYDMVVKVHSGAIEVITKEGEFTEFTVILPL